MTVEDWAPYGIGEPDPETGVYPDYRTPPASVRPAPPSASASPVGETGPQIDMSLLALVTHWRLVVAGLLEHYHIDLYDAAVRARPWPGVRTAIFALIDTPGTRLREALTRR